MAPNLDRELAEWAAEQPRIRRMWLVNGRAAANVVLDVQLELQPVAHSEETLASWIAHRETWRRQLEAVVGAAVELECRDPDDAIWARKPGPGQARTLVYERSG